MAYDLPTWVQDAPPARNATNFNKYTTAINGTGGLDERVSVLEAAPDTGAETVFRPEDYGAVGNGSTDDTTALQLAATAWMAARKGVLRLEPEATYLVSNTILFGDPTTHITRAMLLDGRGASIQATTGIAGKPILSFRNNSIYEWRNLTIQDLQLTGHSSGESELILMDADAPPGSTYNFTLRNVQGENVYGHGIHFKNNVFQARIESCHMLAVSTNTTKYGFYMEHNHTQTTIYDCITYYFLNGLYTATTADWNIIRGTYLLAQNEGIYAKISGGAIIGAHAESCWRNAANQAAGGAGIYAEGFGVLDAISSKAINNQKWGLRVYISREMVVSSYQGPGNATFNWLDAAGDAGTLLHAIGVPPNEITKTASVEIVRPERDKERALLPTGATYATIGVDDVTNGNLATLTSGTLQMQTIKLPKGLLVSTITVQGGSTAAVTPTNQWFALYDSSRNLLGVTADDTTNAWAAGQTKPLALSTPVTTTYDGRYYIGIVVVAATVPTMCGYTAVNTIMQLAPRLAGNSNTALTNPASAPAVANNPSANNARVFAYVS